MTENEIAASIIEAAFKVHRAFGLREASRFGSC